jgi:uncharacterized protein (TIGR03435 family)
MRDDLMRMRGDWGKVLLYAQAIIALAACFVGVSASARPNPQTAALQGTVVAAAPHKLTFDAASIKQNTSRNGRNSLSINMEGGRLHAVNVPLATFMVAAYKIPSNRIIGAPPWFDSEYFDIEATHEDPGPDDAATDDGNDLRLQSLLADRFKLAIHLETRRLPVYDLVLATPGKLGPQLQTNSGNCGDFQQTDLRKPPAASVATSTPASLNCGDISSSGGRARVRVLGRGVTVAKLVEVLSGTPSAQFVERPIVDRTGLTGTIDFDLLFTPPQIATTGDQASADPSAPAPFEPALREELGLQLKGDTGSVDVIVIDHVEQPSAN